MQDIPKSDAPSIDTANWVEISSNLYEIPESKNIETNPPDAGVEKDAPFGGMALSTRLQLSDIRPISRKLGEAESYTLKGFSFNGQNAEQQLEAIKKFQSPTDYGQLLKDPTRVAVFGETHIIPEARHELINNMKEFKELGFTDIALEALPSTRQDLVNDYLDPNGKVTREEMLEVIKEDWNYSQESYLELIDAAKENGLNVICLDTRIPRKQQSEWDKQGDPLKAYKVREAHWNKLIGDRLDQDPNAKVIALVGGEHIIVDPTEPERLTTLLAEGGYNPLAIRLAVSIKEYGRAFDEALQKAQLIDKRFMIPIFEEGPDKTSDYIVNFPRKWKRSRPVRNDGMRRDRD